MLGVACHQAPSAVSKAVWLSLWQEMSQDSAGEMEGEVSSTQTLRIECGKGGFPKRENQEVLLPKKGETDAEQKKTNT